jgi:hypothetical protein
MQRWMILMLIVLVLWLLSLVRMGASVNYDDSGLVVKARVGPVKFIVFPMKKKDKPPKQKKKRRLKEEEPPKKGGNLALVRNFLPLATEAAGRFKKKIRIDKIELDLIWGASDPAAAAMGYGWANAALGMLWPLIEHNFNVRERQLRTSVDYSANQPIITIRAAFSLTIGQGAVLGVVLGLKVLKLFRKEQKLKEAV